jgi:hypothetical protein
MDVGRVTTGQSRAPSGRDKTSLARGAPGTCATLCQVVKAVVSMIHRRIQAFALGSRSGWRSSAGIRSGAMLTCRHGVDICVHRRGQIGVRSIGEPGVTFDRTCAITASAGAELCRRLQARKRVAAYSCS